VSDRRCLVCGASLARLRSDARYCSPGCRREASRIRAVLAGRSDGPYSTLGDLAQRRQRRAKPVIVGGPTSAPATLATSGGVTHRRQVP